MSLPAAFKGSGTVWRRCIGLPLALPQAITPLLRNSRASASWFTPFKSRSSGKDSNNEYSPASSDAAGLAEIRVFVPKQLRSLWRSDRSRNSATTSSSSSSLSTRYTAITAAAPPGPEGLEGPAEMDVVACEFEDGESVMQVCLRHGLPVEASCGGVAACTTCHVYVKEDAMDLFPEPNLHEDDMLDLAVKTSDCSRLGCQLRLDKQRHAGLVLTLPYETWSQLSSVQEQCNSNNNK